MSTSAVPAPPRRRAAALSALITAALALAWPSLSQAEQAPVAQIADASPPADAADADASSAPLGPTTAPDGPSLSGSGLACTSSGRILSLELGPPRVTCQVSGGPATDASFTLSLNAPAGDDRELGLPRSYTLCTGALTDGGGTCSGPLIAARFARPPGATVVSGVLQPSGTTLGPVQFEPGPNAQP
jgi:hypothetical protein